MAKQLWTQRRYSGTESLGAGLDLGTSLAHGSQESGSFIGNGGFRTMGEAGTFSFLRTRLDTNTLTGNSTHRLFEYLGSFLNMNVVFATTETGEKVDDSNTDAVTKDQTLVLQLLQDAGSGSAGLFSADTVWEPSSGGSSLLGALTVSESDVNAGGEYYFVVTGNRHASLASNPIEWGEQNIRVAGTWSYLSVSIGNNSSNDTVTFESMIDSGAGNQSIALPAGPANLLVDDANSDSVSAGSNITMHATTVATAGNTPVGSNSSHYVSTDGTKTWQGVNGSGYRMSGNLTAYTAISSIVAGTVTEADAAAVIPFDATTSELSILISRCVTTSNQTWRTRKNLTDDGNQSVLGTTCGVYTDTSNTDDYTSGDSINLGWTTVGDPLNNRWQSSSLTFESAAGGGPVGSGALHRKLGLSIRGTL